MDRKYTQYLNKIDKLPLEVGFYLKDSKSYSRAFQEVLTSLGVDVNIVDGIMTDLVLSDFNLGQLEGLVDSQLKITPEIRKRLINDIIGKLLLPVERFLPGLKASAELDRRKADTAAYGRYVNDFLGELENTEMGILNEMVSKYSAVVESQEEKIALISLFNNDMADILKFGTKEDFAYLNNPLLFLLVKNVNFKLNLTKTLLENQEVLTSPSFILNGRLAKPTISNWLADFIKVFGSGMPDNVGISNYLVTSPNNKALNEQEKTAVHRLLGLYRNLKFFPDSMQGLPQERWEIFSAEVSRDSFAKARAISGPPKSETELELEELNKASGDYEEGSLEKKLVDEEIAANKKIEELQFIADKFPIGSLERKAIEGEIKRLRR